MKLRYRNDIEDLVAFARFYYQHSPLIKQQARANAVVLLFFLLIGTPIIFLSARGGASTPSDQLVGLVVCLGLPIAALPIVMYFVWQPLLVYNGCNNTRKIYQHNPDKAALGDQELELIGGQLVARNEYCKAYWTLSAIEDVATSPQYVFIRHSGIRAFIIPRGEVPEDELSSFIAELERQCREPVAAMPSGSPPSEAIQLDKSSIQL